MGETETAAETTPTSGGARKRRSETTRWTLQARHPNAEAVTWVDVATVTVSSGTKRKTALLKAAAEWGEAVPEDGVPVRLVPAEHLEVQTLRPKPPEQPQLEVV